MNIVKHSKESSSQQLQKKPSSYWISFIPALLFAALLGTLLDLYFVGKGLYTFPVRPLAEIFSINLAFTVIALPILTGLFLTVCSRISFLKKVGLIFLISLCMSVFEKLAEHFGLFAHTETWKHVYSFFGYFLYLIIVSAFHRWYSSKSGFQ